MKDTQSVEWTRPDSEPGFIECIGKTPIEYQSHTQTTPKANANYGSGISLSRNAAFSVTSAPSFNYNTEFDVGETNLQVRNSSYQGPPIVLPITETLLPSSLYGSFIFISEDGSTIVSNAHGYDASNGGGLGALFIHKEVGGIWTQVATVLSLDVDTDDGLFGFQMSISGDGNRILVTAPTMGAVNRGKAFMLDTPDGWATFTFAPVLALNLPDQSRFGHNCWLSSNGTTAFVGALEPDASGAVYVFEQREGAWSQLQKITASNSAANAYFGAATVDLTALDRLAGNGIASSSTGSQLIIGAPGAVVSAASDQGIVYHFTRAGDNWVEAQIIPLPIADAVNDTIFFGYSVGMSANGSRIVVGVPRSFVIGGLFFTGKIAFYQLCVDGFELIESKAATSPQGSEFSGSCVAISPDGQFAASGAIEYDAEESGQGRVLYYDFDFPFSSPPVVPKPPPVVLPPPPQTQAYSELIISRGPISYFRYGEQSGTTAVDEMAFVDQTYTNSPTLGVAGLIVNDADTAVLFDPSLVHYSEAVSNPNEYSFGNGITGLPYSLEAWVNLVNLSAPSPIFSKLGPGADNNNEYFFEVQQDGSVRAVLYSGSTANNHFWDSPAGIITAGQTYHLVETYTGIVGEGKIFVNGVEVAVSYTTNGSFTATGGTLATLKIGARFVGGGLQDYFNGTIDEPAIYNYVLTPAEIQENYTVGAGQQIQTYSDVIIAAGPDAYYQQDETSGLVAVDSMGLVNGVYAAQSILGSEPLKAGDPKTSVEYDNGTADINISPDASSILHTAGDITVETLYRTYPGPYSIQNRPLVFKGIPGVIEYAINSWYDTGTATHYIVIENENAGTVVFLGPLVQALPRHLAVTWTGGGDIIVYIDGQVLGVINGSVRVGAQTDLVIGAHRKVIGNHHGVISDTAFYSRILPAAEILAHANKAFNL